MFIRLLLIYLKAKNFLIKDCSPSNTFKVNIVNFLTTDFKLLICQKTDQI